MQCEYCLKDVNSYYELTCDIDGILKLVRLCPDCTSYADIREIFGVSLGSTSLVISDVTKKIGGSEK